MTRNTWTVRLTTGRLADDVDIPDLTEDLMDALEADSRSHGPSLSAHLVERTLSAHFDVERSGSVEEAVGLAIAAFGAAMTARGCPTDVAAVEVSLVGEPVPA